jgi:acyl-CoA synthetase (AMP-forming)/AMP-acid ligase II
MWPYPEIRYLGDTITFHARRTPDRLAMRWQGRDTTYREFDGVTNQLAHALLAAGVKRNDRVIYFGKNSADFLFALFGIPKAGACFAPLNWRLPPAELVPVVEDIGASRAIVERELEPTWNAVQKLSGKSIPTQIIDVKETLQASVADRPATPPAVSLNDDDPVLMIYTSGTTGRPKGVVHTHGSINRQRLCEHLERAYEWRDGDVFLNPLPNFHLLNIGLTLVCLHNGVAVSLQRQFDPAEVLAGIQRERPTLLVLTPTLIQMLLDHPDAAKTDMSSVRMTMYAGSPITLGLIKRAIKAMPGKFMQFYGQSETSGAVCLLRPDEHDLNDESKLKSCGRPLPLMELRIVDTEGRDVDDGTPGELLVRTPGVSGGYWNQPEETKSKFVDGWYHTGDIAYRGAEGLYYIFDRAKDMIVTGGENVYAAEVENVVSTHPDVSAVAVVGVPDERWGEAVKAIVIARQGASPASESIIAHCRGKLAGYKIPKSVDFVAAFPMTATGKVSKKDLRAPYWAGHTRQVA